MTETPTTGGVGTPTPTLQKFYLTFGVQYSHTPHPHWPGANPDGWVLIEAVTEARARGLAYLYFKENWSMLTPEAHFPAEYNKRQFYPLGEIARLKPGYSSITVDGRLTIGGAPVECPKFAVPTNPSAPLYYGVFDHERVAVRIEGTLAEDSNIDAIISLGYEVEYVHPGCLDGGRDMFATITEEDLDVKAFELDWANPYECPVCGVSIT